MSNKPCNSKDGCLQKPPSDCVIYNGSYLQSLGIMPSMTLTEIIKIINDAIGSIPEQVNADWNSTSGPSEILNKPSFAEVAFSGDYDDLINKPAISNIYTADGTIEDILRTVTLNNAPGGQLLVSGSTTNAVFQNSLINLSHTNAGETRALAVSSGGSTLLAMNGTSTSSITVNPVLVQTQAAGIVLEASGTGASVSISCTEGITVSSGTSIAFNGTSTAAFNTRVSGLNATNANEFVTLGQIPAPVNIYNSDGTLTGDRTLDGGNNNFVILNTDQLSLNANTNLVLENTTTGDQIVMDSALLSVASFNDISINANGNLQLVGSGGIDVVSSTAFGSTAKGIAAVAPDEFVILSQLSSYVPTSRTLTINGTAFNLTANRSWTIPTIYTSNGSLASNRTISGGGFSLDITNTSSFSVSTSGSTFGFSDTILSATVAGNGISMDSTLFNIAANGVLQLDAIGGVIVSDSTIFNQPTKGQPGTDPSHYIVLSQLDTETIRNQTTEQSPANFNISGNGTIAGVTTTPTLISPTGTDLNINTPAAQMMSFNIGSTDIMHITTDGAAIGGIIPNSARSAPLEVAGNIWSEDAFILGLSGSSTPRSEYGLSGANDAFVRMMNTGNLEFLTNASTIIARVNGTTENFEVMNQIKISGGTPGIGKVLMDSDGSGLGEWTTIGGGSGTVTSVGLTSSDITVGGTSPITTSGTYTLTLPNINANVGTFNNVTVNAKGQVTAASNVSYLTTETDPVVSARTLTLTQGTGITVTNSGVAQSLGASRSWTITNSAPDQTVVLSNGTGISVTGTYPNFTVTNTSPNVAQDLDSVLTEGNSSSQGMTVGSVTTGSVNSGGPGTLALGANTVDTILISSSGNSANVTGSLGVNTASPSEALEVTGNILASGTITASGGGFNSSRILKEDIRHFSKSALDIISRIPVVQFKYKTNKNNVIGFIADEVPEEVLVDGQEAMDIYSTIGVLIKAVQELNDKIDGLGISGK